MKLFNVTPYLLLLEQENSNEETLSKANAEFVKEVYELQRAENDITIVLFQLQYLSCRLVILREHYRTAQKEHLICYSYIIGTLTIWKGCKPTASSPMRYIRRVRMFPPYRPEPLRSSGHRK